MTTTEKEYMKMGIKDFLKGKPCRCFASHPENKAAWVGGWNKVFWWLWTHGGLLKSERYTLARYVKDTRGKNRKMAHTIGV